MKKTVEHRVEISIAEIIKKFKIKNAPDAFEHVHVSCLHALDAEPRETPLPGSTSSLVLAWATEEKSDDE